MGFQTTIRVNRYGYLLNDCMPVVTTNSSDRTLRFCGGLGLKLIPKIVHLYAEVILSYSKLLFWTGVVKAKCLVYYRWIRIDKCPLIQKKIIRRDNQDRRKAQEQLLEQVGCTLWAFHLGISLTS
jgi:hypothetical protein